MKKSESQESQSPSELIDARIEELGDWRGEMLTRLRALIKEADPEVVEEWKWRGVPVWSHDGLICTGETYKNVVKMTFAKGASLKDPSGLFNSSLEGNTRRAIDFHEGGQAGRGGPEGSPNTSSARDVSVRFGCRRMSRHRHDSSTSSTILTGEHFDELSNGATISDRRRRSGRDVRLPSAWPIVATRVVITSRTRLGARRNSRGTWLDADSPSIPFCPETIADGLAVRGRG